MAIHHAALRKTLSIREASLCARQFVAIYVAGGRQWNAATVESYLPGCWHFLDGAVSDADCLPPTSANIARVMRENAYLS